MLPTPSDLTLDEIQSHFGTDEKARRYLEEILWPNGVVCPHCKNADQKRVWEIKENPEKEIRAGLYHCAECKKQFTVTVGTIFEDSHIPLRKWLVAWYLLCSSKKGNSSLQIQRMLGLGSYRTALFMMHRIRYAISHPNFTSMFSGTVEIFFFAHERLIRTSVTDERTAKKVHFEVGRQVRNTIKQNVNVMPEDLPPEPHIRTIRDKFRVSRPVIEAY